MIHPFLVSSAKGAVLTLSWTVTSCVLACYVEKTAHRVLYRLQPHLYDNVSYAYGLDLHNIDSNGTLSKSQMNKLDGGLPSTSSASGGESSRSPSKNEIFWTDNDDTEIRSQEEQSKQMGIGIQHNQHDISLHR